MRACPTPSKRRYATIEDAREGYEQELATSSKPTREIPGCAYPCPCGFWHRSSISNGGGSVHFR
jgi:hypothetical protein